MTREEILAMKPGRELDALVAVEVMHIDIWHVTSGIDGRSYPLTHGKFGGAMDAPEYSTDIAHTQEVVEHIKRKDIRGFGDIRIIWGNYGKTTTPKGPHGQMIYPNELAWYCGIESEEKFEDATAKDLPEAICKAVLLTVLNL